MRNIAYFLLKGTLCLLSALPLKLHYVLGRLVSLFAQYVVRYRLDVVKRNVAGSFPDMGEAERKKIVSGFYRNLGDIIAETVWFGGCTNPERLRKARLVEIANHEVLDEIYEKSPGVVMLFSHAGNWELSGGVLNYNYSDTPSCIHENNYCVVYKKLSSPVWDRIMRDNRMAPMKGHDNSGNYVESKSLIRFVIEHRNEKMVYCIATDQRPYRYAKGSLPVRFMHRDCTTMAAAANLAAKFGFALVYQSMRKDCRGHYSVVYNPICEDASKMPVAEAMQLYYDMLQKDIENNPSNYLWSHKRWK